MSYLLAGAWHFSAAMAFAVALGIIRNGDALLWLRHPEFDIPLMLGSSALFFIPDAWSKKGLLKFLHYPLPDWDVLLLGPASHRNWLTHSPLLPLLLLLGSIQLPSTRTLPYSLIFMGLSIGIGSHLFWDCVGSRSHKIIVVPYWFSLREAPSRVYLLVGAALSLGVALHFALPHSELRVAQMRTYALHLRHSSVSLFH
ncbi:MAG: hypothetical protein JO316_18990 [Abitibacteriaceae bacterium]|nr:hypothetical protein [Abditibacteriaceae bacterium]